MLRTAKTPAGPSRQRRTDRRRARGEDERVVALGAARAGLEFTDAYRSRRAVDTDDFGVRVHLDVESLAEQLRRRHQQRSLVLDDVADVVRKSAIGEGHERPAIEDHDLRGLVQPAQPRGTRRAAGDAADDQNAAGEPGRGERRFGLSTSSLIGTPIETFD